MQSANKIFNAGIKISSHVPQSSRIASSNLSASQLSTGPIAQQFVGFPSR